MTFKVELGGGSDSHDNSLLLAGILSAHTEAARVVTLGPLDATESQSPLFIRGGDVLVRGAGRGVTAIGGSGSAHSSWGCAVECSARRITLEDMTIASHVGRGEQSQVVGYGNAAAPKGGTLRLRRCNIIGGMFGVYDWHNGGSTIALEDCTIIAARFPVCGGSSSGANAAFWHLNRCRIVCDSSLHDTGRTPGTKSEKYRTAYGIYANGGTIRATDCVFEITGDQDMAACLGVGIPPDAAIGTLVELVRPVFRMTPNGSGRVAETESLQPGATITVDGVAR